MLRRTHKRFGRSGRRDCSLCCNHRQPADWSVPAACLLCIQHRLVSGQAVDMSDAQLLGLCLLPRPRSQHAPSFAARLLSEFGGLEGLLAEPAEHLMGWPGLGLGTVARLKALAELSRRGDYRALSQTPVLSDTDTVARFVRRQIGHSQRELFGCLFLDCRHRLIAWEVLFHGTVNRAHVYSREVLKRALEVNAAALILAHNHPSGVVDPSPADLRLTHELRDLLARVDITVLDHMIVAPGRALSMVEHRLLEREV